ncbi:hypothetical protein [Arthrobacter sp. UM1]|uniref:hypothetical protein n=1 Tax=Arthrobacter sp. UM1 TaxID=2766776 RepID=UPI001CF71540|nr:hypothetical protein [Arthrobacter sp. UM1]MCB4208681.1 hypothetical protein [Arthrobacter sp. UM1]
MSPRPAEIVRAWTAQHGSPPRFPRFEKTPPELAPALTEFAAPMLPGEWGGKTDPLLLPRLAVEPATAPGDRAGIAFRSRLRLNPSVKEGHERAFEGLSRSLEQTWVADAAVISVDAMARRGTRAAGVGHLAASRRDYAENRLARFVCGFDVAAWNLIDDLSALPATTFASGDVDWLVSRYADGQDMTAAEVVEGIDWAEPGDEGANRLARAASWIARDPDRFQSPLEGVYAERRLTVDLESESRLEAAFRFQRARPEDRLVVGVQELAELTAAHQRRMDEHLRSTPDPDTFNTTVFQELLRNMLTIGFFFAEDSWGLGPQDRRGM